MTTLDQLPIVVTAQAPQSARAAAHLATRVLRYLLLEASMVWRRAFGAPAPLSVFSAVEDNVDRAAAECSSGMVASADPEAMPTGWLRCCSLYPPSLSPRRSRPHIRYGARVEGVSRRGFDKVRAARASSHRSSSAFARQEARKRSTARGVIDASGTWSTPNWMGGNGLPALGEEAAAARIQYGMPDILGGARQRYVNRRVLVVGSGHSAVGSLIALSELAASQTQTSIVWTIRGDNVEKILGGGANDGLPERGKLGSTLRSLIETGKMEVVRGFRIEAVRRKFDQLEVSGVVQDGSARVIQGIDEIIVATGTKPDLRLARELRLKLDAWLESTEQLAPLIDPNLHSCGSVPPHGHRELAHPEPGYYAIGAKSYGRAPNFLLATGYEQARSVVAALAGDIAAADDVQLVLPETGVCVTDFADQAGGGCCALSRKPPLRRRGVVRPRRSP